MVERLPGLFGVLRLLPLVVAVGDDQPPVSGGLHERFPRAGGRELVVAGIDQRRAAAQLRPRGREPEPRDNRLAFAVLPIDDREHWLGRSDVRAADRAFGGRIGDRDLKPRGDVLGARARIGIAAAHPSEPTARWFRWRSFAVVSGRPVLEASPSTGDGHEAPTASTGGVPFTSHTKCRAPGSLAR